jgi:hypothetical protein
VQNKAWLFKKRKYVVICQLAIAFINDFCEALYSKRGFSKDFIQKFSEKTLVEHGKLDLAVQILFPH